MTDMASESVPAMSVPTARVPTDWKSNRMQQRIRNSYASERCFRLLGWFAVLVSAGFLAFFLITLVGNGVRGFTLPNISANRRRGKEGYSKCRTRWWRE